jgi:hypothetical protein
MGALKLTTPLPPGFILGPEPKGWSWPGDWGPLAGKPPWWATPDGRLTRAAHQAASLLQPNGFYILNPPPS